MLRLAGLSGLHSRRARGIPMNPVPTSEQTTLVNLISLHGCHVFAYLEYEQIMCKNYGHMSPMVQLKSFLFCEYDRTIRPIASHKDVNNVTMKLIPKILEFDEIDNKMELHSWMTLVWTDHHLSWTPSDFDGINYIHVKSDEIWVPDLSVYNSGDMMADQSIPATMCLIYSSGKVSCVPSLKHVAKCTTNYALWPYDSHRCHIIFGSWSHSGEELDFHLDQKGYQMAGYTNNSKWDFKVVNAYKVKKKYTCCPNDTYPMIFYEFSIIRHHGILQITYVTPAIAVMLLTLTVLWLDSRSTERIAIAGVNLICHMLCIFDLHWRLPHNGSNPPNIILYYRDSLALAVFALILTALLRKLLGMNIKVPHWISTTTSFVLNNRAGRFLVLSDEDSSRILGAEMDDNSDLPKSEATSKVSSWRHFAAIVEWLSFFVVLFTYIILLFTLMPSPPCIGEIPFLTNVCTSNGANIVIAGLRMLSRIDNHVFPGFNSMFNITGGLNKYQNINGKLHTDAPLISMQHLPNVSSNSLALNIIFFSPLFIVINYPQRWVEDDPRTRIKYGAQKQHRLRIPKTDKTTGVEKGAQSAVVVDPPVRFILARMRILLFVSLMVFDVTCSGDLDPNHCKNIQNAPLIQLNNRLFCNYMNVRPTENYRNKTTVNVSLQRQHFSVDEYSDMLNLHILMKVTWRDEYLTWTPSEYENIKFIEIVRDKIWLPDITLHSPSTLSSDMGKMNCLLESTGRMNCLSDVLYSVHCESDHTWWPYDLKNCSIEIASWSYSTDDVLLNFATQAENNVFASRWRTMIETDSQWEVIGISTNEYLTNSKFNTNLDTTVLSYNILLRRHAGVHSAITVTTAIVLMTMTLVTLWLEPKSTERMLIANLNFVFHLLGLLQLQWVLPFSGIHLPKLLLFYEDSFIMASCSLILTSILRHLQELTVDAPTWITSASVFILNSKVGQIFLVSFMDPKVSASLELNAEDNANLVSLDRKESTWRYTSILIGWLAFLSFSFTYVILLALLIPRNIYQNSYAVITTSEYT
ncbi:uncharacterized protein LOC143149665 [Ptiloglossa arizonensis]|uniref:uncharacterized protein LOC143149665 n=1 Tax=Ptiloglossa arizonensis TaxID=3350558 RepID=UPI003F9FD7DE